MLAIILSGDIQVNPGPIINTLDRSSVYPCGSCEEPVNWEHKRALCCDNCSLWYHSRCLEESSNKIDLLGHSNVSWICVKCQTQNVDSFTYHHYELDTFNRFSVLSNISSIPSIDSSFSPTAFSSPKPNCYDFSNISESDTSGIQPKTAQAKKKQNLRILIINCQSIRNKRTALSESVDYLKPDIIIGSESWLSKENTNSEIFPDGFQTNVYRKDRNKNGGGVFIAIHDNIQANTVEVDDGNCELVWAEIQTKGKSIVIGSYYRPPSATIDSLQHLSLSTSQILEKRTNILLLAVILIYPT